MPVTTSARLGESRELVVTANHDGLNSCPIWLPIDLLPASDWRIWVGWACCPDLASDESEPFTIVAPVRCEITQPATIPVEGLRRT